MGRPPKLIVDETGAAQVRAVFGPHTWKLVSSYARRLGIDNAIALKILLSHVDALLAAGDTTWLPPEWRQLAKRIDKTPPNIDLTKLHRSAKTKSGFVGVYANGSGFRAVGRRGEYIAQADSAEEAAWLRYLHYKQNGLPYGRLELEIDRYRRRGEQGTDEQLRELVLETARLAGTEHLYVEPGATPSPSSDAPSPRIMGFGDASALDAALAAASQHEAD